MKIERTAATFAYERHRSAGHTDSSQQTLVCIARTPPANLHHKFSSHIDVTSTSLPLDRRLYPHVFADEVAFDDDEN